MFALDRLAGLPDQIVPGSASHLPPLLGFTDQGCRRPSFTPGARLPVGSHSRPLHFQPIQSQTEQFRPIQPIPAPFSPMQPNPTQKER